MKLVVRKHCIMAGALCTQSESSYGTLKRTKLLHKIFNLVATIFTFLTIVTMITGTGVNGQRQLSRRPTVSPALEAYRNRWMAYLKSQTTTVKPYTNSGSVGLRVGGNKNEGLVVNGFQCERTYSFFPNKNNPRMYHLCARNRDSWYVYHYFCPHGSLFQDSMGKCMQENDSTSSNNRFGNRRPSTPTRLTTLRPGIRRTTTRPTRPTTVSTTEPEPTTLRSTTTTTTTTTTTEDPEAVPEPDSDHVGVTDNVAYSSEEASTEDGKDIDLVVSIPGLMTSAEHSQQGQHSSDEVDGATNDDNDASDEVNMIPESANGPSRLVITTTTTSSPLLPAKKKQMPLKRIPLKAISTEAYESAEGNDESGNSDTAGGRRPRILKKWNDFLFGKY